MSLSTQISRFFRNGGRASQFELARMFAVTPDHIRATISRLRAKRVHIGKVLMVDSLNASYYMQVPDLVIPNRGRPAHKFAVKS